MSETNYGYILIDTPEKKKAYAPKQYHDQCFIHGTWWIGDSKPEFYEPFTYRRPIVAGDGWEIVPADAIVTAEHEFSTNGRFWAGARKSIGDKAGNIANHSESYAFRRRVKSQWPRWFKARATNAVLELHQDQSKNLWHGIGGDSSPDAVYDTPAEAIKYGCEEITASEAAEILATRNPREESTRTPSHDIMRRLTHPQIHVDYYEWLDRLSESERHFLQTATPHGLAMWAWTRSRETLTSGHGVQASACPSPSLTHAEASDHAQ